MLRYAITDRTLFAGNERERQLALIRQTALWAEQGIDLIQLREKDLHPGALTTLARSILQAIAHTPTRLLINTDVQTALAAPAHGVHLPSTPAITPAEIRHRYAEAALPAPIITISCHTLNEIAQAKAMQADVILFAPVFEKTTQGQTLTTRPTTEGLEALTAACQAAAPIPVYALGGITHENAPQCLTAGATGIAAIRLFHNLPNP